ncbi:hypothetical protein GH714_016903 [Hevea brasiliensis]|uniref:Pectate lyase superfamily protein domain-containing protein n=1 Tax=Hevea brasiliensis TaxID=3981 RepID=A0A6A6N2J6_HEVBR|nr:hypothetical protein GH714_016903 [Hevea brasiliensis]
MSNKSKKIAISFINTLSLLFGFAAFFSWVYFGLRMGSRHRPLHPNPIIDLGLFLLGISLVKHIVCWCFPGIKKLVTYLASFPMLAIIITTFVVMVFALVVTHKGNGREIPRVSYSKPDLEDYSKSLRRYVEGITRWPPIIRALRDSPICTNYTEDYDHLNHSVRKNVNLTPLQDKKISSKPVFSSFSKLVRHGNTSTTVSSSNIIQINVDDFGAKANGTDDSEAFKKAWDKACSSNETANIVVPENKTYLLKPVTFSGPCQSDLTFQINGTIVAPGDMREYEDDRSYWIVFDNVQKLGVNGGGTIDGNGREWWENSCKINKSNPCEDGPTAVTFNECNNLIVSNLGFKNAQQMHLKFESCINIGSLGANNSEAEVSGVCVDRATLSGTTNGVRIKTWQGGSGYAKNITFKNIIMINVSNPIIIDQNYCEKDVPCPPEQKSAVQVSNVIYKNITGTSATEVAVNFNCSRTFPCQGIQLQGINLEYEENETAIADCVDVQLTDIGNVYPGAIEYSLPLNSVAGYQSLILIFLM